MLNKAMIIGRLGRDPEVRYTQSGKAVCNFSVATDHGPRDNKQTEWHRIVAWDKLAELCGKFLAKGRQVYVEGRIQTRQWEKDGETRYSTEIVAYTVTFLGSRDDSGPSAQQDANDNAIRGDRYERPQNRRGGYGNQGGYGQQRPGGGGYGNQGPEDDLPF